ncbi:MAG TPA: sigma factor, partial [Solirubrobacteraceae bacterium]|nr:sigma factor [Solirubrobacteraceae bacterium]
MGISLAAAATAAPESAATTFAQLYRATFADVYAYVATIVRDRTAAEDVTAQAFERAYRKRRSFDRARGNERAWIFGIARNAALDELRRRKRHATLLAEPPDEV